MGPTPILHHSNLLCLLRPQQLFDSIHHGGVHGIQAVHHLGDAGSIDRVDLELRFFASARS